MKRTCRFCNKPLAAWEGTCHFSCYQPDQSKRKANEALKRLKRKQRRGGGKV